MRYSNRFQASDADFHEATRGDAEAFERLFSGVRVQLFESDLAIGLTPEEATSLLAAVERVARRGLASGELERKQGLSPYFSRVHFDALFERLDREHSELLDMHPASEQEEARLLMAVMRRSVAAFETVHERREPDVYRWALRVTRDEKLAQEATQETFRECHAALMRRAVADLTRFGGYLAKTCRRKALALLKKNKRPNEASLETAFDGETMEVEAESLPVDKLLARIAAASRVTQLAERAADDAYVEAAYWHHVLGLKEKEIAWLRGLPVGTVKTKIHRGVNLLRGWMESES